MCTNIVTRQYIYFQLQCAFVTKEKETKNDENVASLTSPILTF